MLISLREIIGRKKRKLLFQSISFPSLSTSKIASTVDSKVARVNDREYSSFSIISLFSLSICCLEIKHLQKKCFLKMKLICLEKRLRIHVLNKLCLQIAIACLSETGCIQIRQRILSSALRMQIGNFRGCNFSSKFWNIYQKMIFALQNE